MYLLAIETSTSACSTAVLSNNGGVEVLARQYAEMQTGHAEAVLAMIRDAMSDAGVAFEALGRIGVGIGPGSFTGTRVGIAAARGIALATGANVVGASSLAQIAEIARREADWAGSTVAAVLEAGRGEIYLGVFDADGAIIGEPVATAASNAIAMLPDGEVTLAGSGAAAVITAAQGRQLRIAAATWPDAAVLGEMAYRMPADQYPALPLYVREADAKLPADGKLARRTSAHE